jgi:hypothetical protein
MAALSLTVSGVTLAIAGAVTGPIYLFTAASGLVQFGLIDLIRVSEIPKRASFCGQVIARWYQDADARNHPGQQAFFAVDDGERGWTFAGSAANRVTIGDALRLTINPRTNKLVTFTPIQPERAQLPAAPATDATSGQRRQVSDVRSATSGPELPG